MKTNTKKNKSHKSDKFHKAVKYTHSTVDYAGLVTWSIITRCSNAVKSSTLKVVRPVARNATEPFMDMKIKKRKLFGKKVDVDERIKEIKETILQLEERLAFLEKHGVRIFKEGDFHKKKKELDEERKGLLNLIVEENKRLRGLLNT